MKTLRVTQYNSPSTTWSVYSVYRVVKADRRIAQCAFAGQVIELIEEFQRKGYKIEFGGFNGVDRNGTDFNKLVLASA